MLQVLLVDDDPSVREGLCWALKDEFDVVSVGSAEEALVSLASRRASVMLLDEGLPGLSGTGLLARLQEEGGPAAVLLSAVADVELARRAMQLGAEDLLAKPCDLDLLKAALRTAGGHVPQRRLREPVALRLGRIVDEEARNPAQVDLPTRSARLTRRLAAEAMSSSSGDRSAAAQQLGLRLSELEILLEPLSDN